MEANEEGSNILAIEVTEQWKPPPNGWIKINIDAAF